MKPVLSGHSIDKTKVLKTNGNLMKVKSIAECSLGAFCNTLDLQELIISLENQFLVLLRVAILDRFYCILLRLFTMVVIMFHLTIHISS